MEINNNFMPELHVAQQRRRDKLRVQHFEELQQLHHHQQLRSSIDNNTPPPPPPSQMILSSPEMLNFSGSHSSNPFSNIHPTRFVAPSSSNSCELQQSQPPTLVGGCDSWVQTHFVDHDNLTPQIADYQNNNNNNNNNNNVQSWGNSSSGNELPLLPANFVTHHQQHHNHHYQTNDASSRLSLSLSSNQIYDYQHLNNLDPDPQELKPFESGSISSVVKQSMSGSGNNKLDCVNNYQIAPLGPFTGYAAVLKSSKFLRPAQQILDELFSAAGLWRGGDEAENDPRSHNIMGGSNVMVSKMEGSNDFCGRSPSPDCHERKAKLLHMQQEVCKRHKQYHQQMQMVMSAFDSVPGLSNATPYISRSLRTISRHFRNLKNAIADQLKHIKRILGEDLSSPTSFLRGDSSSSLRYDQNFGKVRSGTMMGGMGHVAPQSHVWRPQRGLPERAVSILRAWLFEHFLHPYPTDNDKQILATQTGLTRNQVSNWFINARVRLWKPMVEEIHMLETKSSSRSEPNSNDSVMSIIEKNRQQATAAANQSVCKPSPLNSSACDKQLECLAPSSSLEQRSRGGETINTEQLFQKCSRLESHQVPTSIDSSFIGFLPYQRRGLELGGIGAVSLTLGLRHGSENTQQQLQHQFLPQGLPYGGHVLHDYSG